MNPEELKTLLDQVSAQVKTELKAAASGFITPEMLTEKLATLEGDKAVIAELKTAVETQGMELLKLMQNGQNMKQKSIVELLNEKKSDLEQIAKSGSGRILLKVPFDTPVASTDVSGNVSAFVLPGVNQLATLKPTLRDLFGPSIQVPAGMNNTIGYYEQLAATRGAAARSEGATTGESKLTWIYRTIGLHEIADAIAVNRESLKFIPFVAGELNNLLTTNLALKEDEYLYDGDGNAPIITGVKTVATEFAAAAYAASAKFKFDSANLFDLILAMVVDLENGKESKFKADFVLMNRGDSIAVKGEKNDFGSYLMPPFVTPDGKTIDGLRVYESSQVDLGTIIVGDSTKGKIYDGDGIEIQMGWINEQLLENAVTLRASRYMALVIKELDKPGFMKCTDIPTALTAIQKVGA